jgi:hypothetical protein
MKKLIAIVSLALCLPAFAGQSQQKDLECLIGSWKVSGTAKMPGSDKVHNVNGTYDCKKTGAAISCAMNLNGLPDGMKLEGIDTWAYNAGDDSVHVFSVDNMGGAGDVAGKINGQTFKGHHASTYQSKPYSKDLSMVFANENTFKLVCVCSFGSRIDVNITRA